MDVGFIIVVIVDGWGGLRPWQAAEKVFSKQEP